MTIGPGLKSACGVVSPSELWSSEVVLWSLPFPFMDMLFSFRAMLLFFRALEVACHLWQLGRASDLLCWGGDRRRTIVPLPMASSHR